MVNSGLLFVKLCHTTLHCSLLLYGHIENDEDCVDHLLKLRALQDETHGFQTFIPLAFHPANTPLQHLSTTTGCSTSSRLPSAALSR
jgi:2-iminoacetate synthase ThiH